jgi:hypothetical protein
MNEKKLAISAAAAIVAAGLAHRGNTKVGVTHYAVTQDTLPSAFNGFRIAVVSDLHNTIFGKNNRGLISPLEEAAPDLIAVTGDMVDKVRTDIGVTAAVAGQLTAIAPVFYVTGNHEGKIGEWYRVLEKKLLSAGVTVLRDRSVPLRRGNDTVTLIGLDDPRFTDENLSPSTHVLDVKLRGMDLPEGYRIVLSHRPEAFVAYVSNGIDLALCGHAHGGQIRLPRVGGLFAPHQGFFPKYDAGLFTENGTTMIVSRGLGNSKFPFRVNDRPELVIVDLFTKETD